ncbi:MAG: helix-turn-helix transcriptional regulator [Ruminococcaceae bacterium]|nr:helix-turn-helix transcriptional regulator [Oscillospiraceae bacterium]
MYIDYSKLWKLLAEKGISKSDLTELTGLSSRIIAKLAKNETVTTDTVARICTALSCDVGDIMECSNESSLSLYNYARTFGELIEENDGVKKIGFTFKGQKYAIYFTKKAATKATRIYCEADNTVYWEQSYIMGGICTPTVVKSTLVKPERGTDEIAIVVIKGKPSVITGLDEGIWVSAKKGILQGSKDIFVMSEAVFKLFAPKI